MVQSLIKTAKALKDYGLNDLFIIHKLIMRSLFLFYLEDRKATPIELYQKFLPEATSFSNILEDVDSTYNLFVQLSNDFNGSLLILKKTKKILLQKSICL